ncbi:hypothetical protein PVAND_007036 [Polypedilum vanderplanki]|uniref:Peptidase M14 domain-containing protein n=1 Tax=Polypedilum vanderplanki TaxID=319348 RepID=A0A9J6C562_POLVA|nr:hypothetical protein PVAND_007036 [Polypedilum vanderplanki]
MRSIIFFTIYVSFALCKDYSNYKVFEIMPTRQQLDSLMKWEFEAGIDFWSTGEANKPSRVMVSPEIEQLFLQFLNLNDIQHKMTIENVELVLENDKIARLNSRAKRNTFIEPNFRLYWSYNEIENFLQRLANEYPDLVKKDVIGQSIEHRNIHGVRVSRNAEFGKNPIIFIDAGTHAREWAGIHSALYFLHQLVENSTVTNELLDKVDYVFVPVVNPDGYAYSFTEDRLWRKNRRYVNYTCQGIDLNRNYAYMWRYRENSCAGTGYPGAYALSEPETQAMAAYMQSFKYNFKLYLSTHTYGSLVLWPFGFEFIYVKNHKEHHLMGEKFRDAIYEATGTLYRVGNSADILYTANGASDDFALAYANANFAYTLELPGGGSAGFDYPQSMIYDLVRETFIGYRQFGLHIKERFN